VDPTLNYNETNTLLVHYSAGVPLAGMPRFFDRLRAAAPVLPYVHGTNSALIRDRFNLHRARAFATAELNVFHLLPGAPVPGSQASRALDGYLQLAYMQICAVADHLDYPAATRGNIKNLTAVLCRAALIDVRPLLSAAPLNFLNARCAGTHPLIDSIAAFQETPEPGRVADHDFHEDGERRSGHLVPITLLDFALSAFTGNVRVAPARIFGGMREIPTHAEQGVQVVPMELRSVGNEAKSWLDVQGELGHLCNWAHEAFLLA